MNLKIILIIVVAILTGVGLYQILIREQKPDFVLEEVIKGTIVQTISEAGTVEAAQNINLNFQNSGQITRIYVREGDKVRAGQNLARINTAQLEIQLTEARAVLTLAEAKLNQLLAGASPEEIRSAEIAVSNAEIVLSNSIQNLQNIESVANASLDEAYKNALSVLRSAYLQLDNALESARVMHRTHFTRSDQESFRIHSNKIVIEDAFNRASISFKNVQNGLRNSIDVALSDMENALAITVRALSDIQTISATYFSAHNIFSPEKTTINANRGTINVALENIVESQQNIFRAKLTNETNVNTAKARVDTSQGELQRAKNALSIKIATPRQVDIALYQAQIDQARAVVNFTEEQIRRSLLLSPIQGTVARIYKQSGETAQIMDSVISIISADTLQIKVNIYEEDVTRIGLNNPVIIAPIALPNQTFEGKIAAIDPTEKLIDGVVHYEVTVIFTKELPQEIKSGMTVDITIQIVARENALMIREDALQRENGQFIVRVFRNDLAEGRDIKMIEYRDVEIGLTGEDGKVEIVSGLEEGERVVIGAI